MGADGEAHAKLAEPPPRRPKQEPLAAALIVVGGLAIAIYGVGLSALWQQTFPPKRSASAPVARMTPAPSLAPGLQLAGGQTLVLPADTRTYSLGGGGMAAWRLKPKGAATMTRILLSSYNAAAFSGLAPCDQVQLPGVSGKETRRTVPLAGGQAACLDVQRGAEAWQVVQRCLGKHTLRLMAVKIAGAQDAAFHQEVDALAASLRLR